MERIDCFAFLNTNCCHSLLPLASYSEFPDHWTSESSQPLPLQCLSLLKGTALQTSGKAEIVKDGHVLAKQRILVAAMISRPDCTSFSSCSCISSPTSERSFPKCGVEVQKALVQEPGRDAGRAGGWSHHESASQRVPRQQRRHDSSYISRIAPAKSLFNTTTLLFLVFITLSLCCGCATAQELHGDQQRSAPVAQLDFAWKGYLLVDHRAPPTPPRMHLVRRASTAPSKSTSAPSSAAASSLNVDASPTPSVTAIPEPFDSALGNNFTAPCQTFFQNFLSNDTFNLCHPFSLLLQTSSAFFDASKSFVRITQTLDATCNVNFNTCLAVMNEFGKNIKNDSNCAVDYANDNPLVLQAYNGLIAYQPLYQAGCLRDNRGNYCFANAITNTTAVTDSYPYYLPLGVSLPGSSRPTCNTCLQDTMALFSSFAANVTQPLSQTYALAAQQIDIGCGPSFVNQTAAPLKGDAGAVGVNMAPTITLLIMLLALFL
ncbi:hypothetical protein K432DRAFT_385103 [Lepidopterella palustris CBS 459.81]|uniref:DUF7729 domain-containing protein n=1 Tax=Lepidopterella palustris CBS 459.81 TaxID=1314670 RepID=A0A8E2E3U7_9PEZI|nr:hypothetical protein K432DRAFT_385103 [Lepidopterella palustris CBS 459.81]